MRRGFITLAVLLSASLASGEHVGVYPFSGGTGFVVQGRYLVTARHVWASSGRPVSVDMNGVTATFVRAVAMDDTASDANILSDGVAIYRLEGKPERGYKSLTIAESVTLGEAISVPGYPRGRFARKHGVLRPGDGVNYNVASFVAIPGDSGAPVLNADGEVLGVVLASDPTGSIIVGRDKLAAAVALATKAEGVTTPAPPAEYRPVAKREIVVFSSDDCHYCDLLEADIRAGHFREFNMVIVKRNRAGVWSDDDTYREFLRDRNPAGPPLAYPTIWVRGTASYKVGYTPARRGGLIGFIGGILNGLADAIVGQRTPPTFPVDPAPAPSQGGSAVPGGDPAPMPEQPREPREESSDLTAAVAELKADISALKDGSIFEKIGAIRSLREDVTAVKSQASEALLAASNARSGAASELRAQAEKLKADIEGVRSGNPFLKARSALALKADIPDTINLAKKQVEELKSFKLESLIGLLGAAWGVYRRRKEDQESEAVS